MPISFTFRLPKLPAIFRRKRAKVVPAKGRRGAFSKIPSGTLKPRALFEQSFNPVGEEGPMTIRRPRARTMAQQARRKPRDPTKDLAREIAGIFGGRRARRRRQFMIQ